MSNTYLLFHYLNPYFVLVTFTEKVRTLIQFKIINITVFIQTNIAFRTRDIIFRKIKAYERKVFFLGSFEKLEK
jgi:hypothetical protein